MVAAASIGLIATMRPSLRYGHVTAGVLIASSTIGESAMSIAFERTLAIGLGALLAAVAAVLIFPESAHARANYHLAQTLDRCGDLLSASIAGLLGERSKKLGPIHDDIRFHIHKTASTAEQSRRSHPRGRTGPLYSHLIPGAQRLWDTLIMIERVHFEPLSEEASQYLGPALKDLAEESCSYPECLGPEE